MALTDQLTSYWRLNEASGNRADSHTGGNTLTDNNTVGAATGKLGNAAQFVATNQEYFTKADDASIGAGDIDWTFNFWLYWDGTPPSSGAVVVIAKDDGTGANGDFQLYWDGGASLWRFYVFSGAGRANRGLISFAGASANATWYMVTIDHSATNNTVGWRINGGARTSAATTGAAGRSSQPFRISGQAGSPGNSYGNFRVDEVGFWKRSLTDAEATQLYGSGAGLTYPFSLTVDLKSYWKLDESSGSRADAWGTRTLTDVNTVGNAFGKLGNAAQFVAANSEYLSRASDSDLWTGSLPVTITGWVYFDSLTGQQAIVSRYSSTEFEWLLYTSGTTLNFFVMNNAGASASATSGALATGVWLFFAAWYDQANVYLRINTTVYGPTALAGPGRTTNVALLLGAYNLAAPTYLLSARVDEVGFWRRVLASSELDQLFNSGTGYNGFLPVNKAVGWAGTATVSFVPTLPVSKAVAWASAATVSFAPSFLVSAAVAWDGAASVSFTSQLVQSTAVQWASVAAAAFTPTVVVTLPASVAWSGSASWAALGAQLASGAVVWPGTGSWLVAGTPTDPLVRQLYVRTFRAPQRVPAVVVPLRQPAVRARSRQPVFSVSDPSGVRQ